jgi:hypothetical protein
MSLRHGARQLMDMFQADEDEAMRLLDLAIARLKYNPEFAIEKIHAAQARISAIRERRTQELPEHIQKAAPPIERRIDEMQQQLKEVFQRLEEVERPNITRFRKEA